MKQRWVLIQVFGLMKVWGPFDTWEEAKDYSVTLGIPLKTMLSGYYVVVQIYCPEPKMSMEE